MSMHSVLYETLTDYPAKTQLPTTEKENTK